MACLVQRNMIFYGATLFIIWFKDIEQKTKTHGISFHLSSKGKTQELYNPLEPPFQTPMHKDVSSGIWFDFDFTMFIRNPVFSYSDEPHMHRPTLHFFFRVFQSCD
jgi:hypothetical protein